MTSSSNGGSRAFPNVPAPPGSRGAVSYSRIIPREELGDFASWQPGNFGQPDKPAQDTQAAADHEPAQEEVTAQEWQVRIAEARKAGYQDGYRDGLVGLENFKQSFATQTTAQVGQFLAALDGEWTALETTLADALVRTSLQLGRRVLRQELATRPEAVVPLAEDAVRALMSSARRVELHVHPDDLQLVKQAADELLASRGARLVPDPHLARGGCRIHSDLGTVDADIATRWAQAAAELGESAPWNAGESDVSHPDAQEART